VLAPQPIPNGTNRVPRGELTIWTTHAFGSAIGLVDCWHEDSVMSTNWRRASRFQVRSSPGRPVENTKAGMPAIQLSVAAPTVPLDRKKPRPLFSPMLIPETTASGGSSYSECTARLVQSAG